MSDFNELVRMTNAQAACVKELLQTCADVGMALEHNKVTLARVVLLRGVAAASGLLEEAFGAGEAGQEGGRIG